MYHAHNVQLFRPRGHRVPGLSEVRSALTNLGFTVVDGDLCRYKADLIPHPVVRMFVLHERTLLKVSSLVMGIMAISGATLFTLGFLSGFDIPQLHQYRLGPILSIILVVSIVIHMMFEAVTEQVPTWTTRSCDARFVAVIQRKVRDVEHFAVMQLDSMECWQRHMVCTLRRAGTGETVHFHVRM